MEYDILKGYTIINGFGFTSLGYPYNVHNAIIVKGNTESHYESPQYDVPEHTIQEYIEFINNNQIQKAILMLDSIDFLPMCPSLKFIDLILPREAMSFFDFSPLYEMPEIKDFSCQNQYGERKECLSEIDYLKMNGLISLGIHVNKGALNYNKVETLKTLHVSGFKGANRDLTDLFCSKELDTLRLIQCGIHSLNGIETSHKMQCLYLYYNRSLSDISALYKVKGTLKALRIENCPKIQDFSALSELENLELLELSGSNILTSLDFLKTMKSLKTFTFNMNVLDGDLSLCMNLSYVYSQKDRKHYNLKDKELPKAKYVQGNENIEGWRRLE